MPTHLPLSSSSGAGTRSAHGASWSIPIHPRVPASPAEEARSDPHHHRHLGPARLQWATAECAPGPHSPHQQRRRLAHSHRRARHRRLPDRPRHRLLHRQPSAGRARQGWHRRLRRRPGAPLHRRGGGQLRRPPLRAVAVGDYSAQANQWVDHVAIAIANWSVAIAVASMQWLLSLMGQSTEPDLRVIVPVYDRMLAISLLLVGAIMALALIERIAWGSLGTGLALIPGAVAPCFFPYSLLPALKSLSR